MKELAPIAIFAYNRPDHLKKVIESLIENDKAKDSDVIFFCDGPRSDSDKEKAKEIKDYIDNLQNIFKSITTNYSKVNKGLSKSIVSGVTKVIEQYGKICNCTFSIVNLLH